MGVDKWQKIHIHIYETKHWINTINTIQPFIILKISISLKIIYKAEYMYSKYCKHNTVSTTLLSILKHTPAQKTVLAQRYANDLVTAREMARDSELTFPSKASCFENIQ